MGNVLIGRFTRTNGCHRVRYRTTVSGIKQKGPGTNGIQPGENNELCSTVIRGSCTGRWGRVARLRVNSRLRRPQAVQRNAAPAFNNVVACQSPQYGRRNLLEPGNNRMEQRQRTVD